MHHHLFVKALVAGLAFPAICAPLLYGLAVYMQPEMGVYSLDSAYTPLFTPLICGIANIVYVRLTRIFTKVSRNNLLLAVGILLGVIVSLLHIQTLFLDFFPGFKSVSIIVLPLVYALMFRFIVKWFNKVLGVE